MYFKTIISLLLLLSASFNLMADNISANQARSMANGFIKTHFKASPGTLRAPAMSDLMLTHAEPSDKIANANCYYIFNIKGGGFIIVSGDDCAAPVLGYSDKGVIDVNNMSEPLKDLLYGYKMEMEFLKTHDDVRLVHHPSRKLMSQVNNGVEPLIKTTWGPEEPYNAQCPTLKGVNSKVGCVGVFMAQLLYFWRFPEHCDSLPTYWAGRLNAYVPALPPTDFDYNKMLLSYSHWDFDTHKVVQDIFNEEQIQEVAKLCRYCGQSVSTNYSPSSSPTTKNKLDALKKFGYNSKAYLIKRANYESDEWKELLRAELDAGRPISYAGYHETAQIGHAFFCDGYNDEDYYHMNMGWYGVNDGWYLLEALDFTNRYDEYRNYVESRQSMVLGLEPPMFCKVAAVVEAGNEIFVLGGSFDPRAVDVDLNMSYRTLPFMFSLTDTLGNQVALGDSIMLDRIAFEQHSDISLPFILPENLPEGIYNLNFNYRTGDGEPLTVAATAQGQLTVVGRFAKYDAPFNIADVVEAIDYILYGTPSGVKVNIADITGLIDYLLEG